MSKWREREGAAFIPTEGSRVTQLPPADVVCAHFASDRKSISLFFPHSPPKISGSFPHPRAFCRRLFIDYMLIALLHREILVWPQSSPFVRSCQMIRFRTVLLLFLAFSSPLMEYSRQLIWAAGLWWVDVKFAPAPFDRWAARPQQPARALSLLFSCTGDDEPLRNDPIRWWIVSCRLKGENL